MNKNFPDADEDDGLITKFSLNEKTADRNEYEEFAAPFSKIENERDLPETSESESKAAVDSEKPEIADTSFDSASYAELLRDEQPNDDFDSFTVPDSETISTDSPAEPIATDYKKIGSDYKNANDGGKAAEYEFFAQRPYQSESSDETIRKSGLAYSAAIILFASIVFTLILGWFADLLFGTSPWGKVGGILLGSVIGFIQFFRTTSQLVKNKD